METESAPWMRVSRTYTYPDTGNISLIDAASQEDQLEAQKHIHTYEPEVRGYAHGRLDRSKS